MLSPGDTMLICNEIAGFFFHTPCLILCNVNGGSNIKIQGKTHPKFSH